MFVAAAALLATLARGVPSTPLPAESYSIFESVNVPSGWFKQSAVPDDHLFTLRIGLARPRRSELEQHLYEISSPSHSRYRQFLTKAEADDLVRPTEESSASVFQWLTEHGISSSEVSTSSAGDWITIADVPVYLASELLGGAQYSIYTHSASGDSIVRTTAYSLPSHLHEAIDVVAPTTYFSRTRLERTLAAVPSEYDGSKSSEDLVGNTLSEAATNLSACDPTLVTSLCLR